MRRLALSAIRIYQQRLSPRKGFHCGYRSCTGHASCSSLGARAIRRYGLLAGLQILRQRLVLCRLASDTLRRLPARPLHPQRGNCDNDCNCDLGNDVDCCDFGDDEGGKRRRDARRLRTGKSEQGAVHLPPQRAARRADPQG